MKFFAFLFLIVTAGCSSSTSLLWEEESDADRVEDSDPQRDTDVTEDADILEDADIEGETDSDPEPDADPDITPIGPYWTIETIAATKIERLGNPPPNSANPIRVGIEMDVTKIDCWQTAPVHIDINHTTKIVTVTPQIWVLQNPEEPCVVLDLDSPVSKVITLDLGAGTWTVVEPVSGSTFELFVEELIYDSGVCEEQIFVHATPCTYDCTCAGAARCLGYCPKTGCPEERRCFVPCSDHSDCFDGESCQLILGHDEPDPDFFYLIGVCIGTDRAGCELHGCSPGYQCNPTTHTCNLENYNESMRHECETNADCEEIGFDCVEESWADGVKRCGVRCSSIGSQSCPFDHTCDPNLADADHPNSPLCKHRAD